MRVDEKSTRFLVETWAIVRDHTITTILEELEHPVWSKAEAAGVGAYLADIYMAMEQTLRTLIERVYGEKPVKDASWHERLLRRGFELELVPREIEQTVKGMLKYRHRMVHGYSSMLDERIIRKNAPEAIHAFRIFVRHVATLLDIDFQMTSDG